MGFKIPEEKLLEVTKRYGLRARKSETPGFHLDGEKVSTDELFDHLFGEYLLEEELETKEFFVNVKVKKGHTNLTFKNMNNNFEYKEDGVA